MKQPDFILTQPMEASLQDFPVAPGTKFNPFMYRPKRSCQEHMVKIYR